MIDKLLKIAKEHFSEDEIVSALEERGVDVEHALAALDDSVQKDQSDWEKIKHQPKKKSSIASGKPKEHAIGSIKGHRSALPVYLEDDCDSMGVGE
jgi:ribosomal protein L12E/L44/L45/RPP1/RPP2